MSILDNSNNMFKFTLLAFAIIALQGALCIEIDDVKYFLYTAKNREVPTELSLGHFSSGDSIDVVDTTNTVKILCHGFVDDGFSYWVEPTKNAFMNNGAVNVVSVDWSKRAYDLYHTCVLNARGIGEHIAELIIEMHETFGIPYEKFHLIGHSLGSHISGYAGKKVLEVTGQKVGRITGMDPAGPLFNGNSEAKRLCKDDALFVDIMHTDTLMAGYKKSIGHVDYWPNGGSAQAGCSLLDGCSHTRAPEYFYESIGNKAFPAWECDSFSNFNSGNCSSNQVIYMGDNCDTSARGDFYLATNEESPFGQGTY